MALPQVNLTVEVVAADRIVWQGEATSVLARTTEGDIGIMRNHEPLLAALVPCAAEVVRTDGTKQIIALDGGFLSVEVNRVSLISSFARLAEEIDQAEAQASYDALRAQMVDAPDDALVKKFRKAEASIKAIEKLKA